MSQHDFDIANQTASNARADINDALQALASLSAGASAPATTYANMPWYDISNNILKMRSEADDAWISLAYIDQTTNAFRVLDDTQVVNTSGTQTGLLGDQATSAWETGTGTTESLVSPAKIKAAIESLVPPSETNLFSLNSVSAGGNYRIIDTSLSETSTFSYTTLKQISNFYQAGTVRVAFDHSSSAATADARVLVDGVQLAVFTTGSTPTLRTVDASVSVGSTITIQGKSSSSQSSRVQNFKLGDDGVNPVFPLPYAGFEVV